MPPSKVLLRVPATSANLGPGFDCLGLALDLWSEATLSFAAAPVDPPSDPLERMGLDAARAFYQTAAIPTPGNLTFEWRSGFAVARGLGASAAVRAAALVGANALAGNPLNVESLLSLGASLEHHADNITPALLGGLQVAVWEGAAVSHASVTLPSKLKVVLFVPDLTMATKESRRLLAPEVPRGDAVYNVGHASLLVAALASRRFDLLAEACNDRLHQPARSQLLPALFPVVDAAKSAGALCAYLSGSGSTIAGWTMENERAIAQAMLEAARAADTPGETIITAPSTKGAHVVATE